jgi:hypothetical protein
MRPDRDAGAGGALDRGAHGRRVAGVAPARDGGAGDQGEHGVVVGGGHPVDRLAEIGVEIDDRHDPSVPAARVRPLPPSAGSATRDAWWRPD